MNVCKNSRVAEESYFVMDGEEIQIAPLTAVSLLQNSWISVR